MICILYVMSCDSKFRSPSSWRLFTVRCAWVTSYALNIVVYIWNILIWNKKWLIGWLQRTMYSYLYVNKIKNIMLHYNIILLVVKMLKSNVVRYMSKYRQVRVFCVYRIRCNLWREFFINPVALRCIRIVWKKP